jgi:hypothetical protein
MALPSPSTEDLDAWLRQLQHEANAEREAAKRLATQYWHTDARDPAAVAALWQALVHADQAAQASRARVIDAATAYEAWIDRQPHPPLTPAERVTHALTVTTWPDLSGPQGVDPVLCAGACLRIGRHDALQLAVVRHVLAYFATLMSDARLRLPQDLRKQAQRLLDHLEAPLRPTGDKGVFQGNDLGAREWLLSFLHAYDTEYPRIRQILRAATDTPARIATLHATYGIPSDALGGILDRAFAKDKVRLRAAFLTEVLLLWQYGSEATHTGRHAITRARFVRRLEDALNRHRTTTSQS